MTDYSDIDSIGQLTPQGFEELMGSSDTDIVVVHDGRPLNDPEDSDAIISRPRLRDATDTAAKAKFKVNLAVQIRPGDWTREEPNSLFVDSDDPDADPGLQTDTGGSDGVDGTETAVASDGEATVEWDGDSPDDGEDTRGGLESPDGEADAGSTAAAKDTTDDDTTDDEDDGPETNDDGYITEGKMTFTLGDGPD